MNGGRLRDVPCFAAGALLALALAHRAHSQSVSSAGPQTLEPARTAPETPARPRYHLRAGDVVVVDYRLTPEFNQTATIQPDGFISLPLAGELHAAGLTLEEVRTAVLQRTASHLKDPEVNVTLKDFERPFFVVASEVPHPGKLDFYEKTTALQAILLAGGFSASAQQSDVYVFRRIDDTLSEVHRLNLKGIKSNGKLEQDLVLKPGDMILVPRNKLEIVGRFKKSTNLSVYFDPLNYTPH